MLPTKVGDTKNSKQVASENNNNFQCSWVGCAYEAIAKRTNSFIHSLVVILLHTTEDAAQTQRCGTGCISAWPLDEANAYMTSLREIRGNRVDSLRNSGLQSRHHPLLDPMKSKRITKKKQTHVKVEYEGM